jgi:hypothetical protein
MVKKFQDTEKIKIVGFQSGHDVSYCVLGGVD